MKDVVLGTRFTANQVSYINQCAKNNGFHSVSNYIRSTLLKGMPKKLLASENDFRYTRMQNRIFRCDQKMWDQISEKSENKSHFIRQSIREKLERSSHSGFVNT